MKNQHQSIWTIAAVLPRMEWPFIRSWIEYLAGEGVDRVVLGVDRARQQGYVWAKKPHPAIYWPEMSEEELQKVWDREIQAASQWMPIEQTELPWAGEPGREIANDRRQRVFFERTARYARKNGADWLLNHDVDEFPESSTYGSIRRMLEDQAPDLAVVFMQQYLFGSRWTPDDKRVPRARHEIRDFHPKVLMIPKYAFRPTLTRRLKVHSAVPVGGCSAFTAEPEDLVYKHYRGIEKAWEPLLQKIDRLDGIWEG